ncbi:unnamed protein product [Amoebophrya sp. A120]|nr:unnamed protein product [Amoebophrya sp. A120]|eukprot:GSA120T00015377001.1
MMQLQAKTQLRGPACMNSHTSGIRARRRYHYARAVVGSVGSSTDKGRGRPGSAKRRFTHLCAAAANSCRHRIAAMLSRIRSQAGDSCVVEPAIIGSFRCRATYSDTALQILRKASRSTLLRFLVPNLLGKLQQRALQRWELGAEPLLRVDANTSVPELIKLSTAQRERGRSVRNHWHVRAAQRKLLRALHQAQEQAASSETLTFARTDLIGLDQAAPYTNGCRQGHEWEDVEEYLRLHEGSRLRRKIGAWIWRGRSLSPSRPQLVRGLLREVLRAYLLRESYRRYPAGGCSPQLPVCLAKDTVQMVMEFCQIAETRQACALAHSRVLIQSVPLFRAWQNVVYTLQKHVQRAGARSLVELQCQGYCLYERDLRRKTVEVLDFLRQHFIPWWNRRCRDFSLSHEMDRAICTIGPAPPPAARARSTHRKSTSSYDTPPGAQEIDELSANYRYFAARIDVSQSVRADHSVLYFDARLEELMAVLAQRFQLEFTLDAAQSNDGKFVYHVRSALGSLQPPPPRLEPGQVRARTILVSRDELQQPAHTTATHPVLQALVQAEGVYDVTEPCTREAEAREDAQQVSDAAKRRGPVVRPRTISGKVELCAMDAGGPSWGGLGMPHAQTVAPGHVVVRNLPFLVTEDPDGNEKVCALSVRNCGTLLHELGHAIHFLATPLPEILALEHDIAEFPSTMMQFVFEEPTFLRSIALSARSRRKGLNPESLSHAFGTEWDRTFYNYRIWRDAYVFNEIFATTRGVHQHAHSESELRGFINGILLKATSLSSSNDGRSSAKLAGMNHKHNHRGRAVGVSEMDSSKPNASGKMFERSGSTSGLHPLLFPEVVEMFCDSSYYSRLAYIFPSVRARQQLAGSRQELQHVFTRNYFEYGTPHHWCPTKREFLQHFCPSDAINREKALQSTFFRRTAKPKELYVPEKDVNRHEFKFGCRSSVAEAGHSEKPARAESHRLGYEGWERRRR